jgi:hypothetical protein
VLPVEAQITASAPAPLARETATVMPRSLKLPVGLVPSNFSQALAPIRSESRGASISGVLPSLRVTTGSSGSRESRSLYRSMSGCGISLEGDWGLGGGRVWLERRDERALQSAETESATRANEE